ncbi:alkaline phosphatase PafA [Cognatitamlana onchidii]|uniref:alkaline phosphatase PafA n=1 Tax=Cognatitamlana onchidii TaxID=2562860 RepID=UPI0010A6924D|nr:alkaline phosphatase PafA [Algibacter onchidii]
MRNILVLLTLSVFLNSSYGQVKNEIRQNPKLVVGIVVDQMRYDYLTRFYNKYGEGGFKRMIREGFNCKNNHFNYIPTYTGPGHASIYTGTTPKYHGIIANNWYDKYTKSMVYCAGDSLVKSIGTSTNSGQMSPHRLMSTTFGDENRLFTQMRGKTIGISIKDRGAVLPAGHAANGAYWFHGKKEGVWISSSYYMEALPKWVKDFNNSGIANTYFKDWNTLYNISSYVESGPDLNEFEGEFKGKDKPTFPYNLKKLKKKNGYYDILKFTPYGNSLTTDFAIAAIEGEALGKDYDTDVLTVSFSSTDYIGHKFGVNSKEIEDTYIRLDIDLERLFLALDKRVGKNEYVVFLTADHGAVDVPAYLKSHKIEAGYVYGKNRKEKFQKFLMDEFGDNTIVENISSNQIFLNKEKIKALGLSLEDVQNSIANEQITYNHVYKTFTANSMVTTNYSKGIEALLQNGYNQKRSGDVLLVNAPNYIYYRKTGTTHGSGFNYDTHVPLLFLGKGIKQGATFKRTEIPDIAPTISALLGISFPNAATGQPLEFVLKND